MRLLTRVRPLLVAPVLLCALLAGGAVRRAQDVCGPFTDVSAAFCPYVLEMYYLGITAGTSPTTFSPDAALTRGQAAVFVSKGVNQAIARSSRRAALGQWWTTTPHWTEGLGVTTIPRFPGAPVSDGADIWVPDLQGTVSRVRASDGKLLESWTAASGAAVLASMMGRIFVAGELNHNLYMIDPAAPPGAATLVASDIGAEVPRAIAFDGSRIWVTNCCGMHIPPGSGPPGSVSIITPGTWEVQTITAGFENPYALVFDGASMWVQDIAMGLLRVDASGAVVQTVPGTAGQGIPVFDGVNIWLPNYSSAKVTVVRASNGEIVATLPTTLTPMFAAFDGSRVLISNGLYEFELWDAQSLTPIGSFFAGTGYSGGACSDGINFWLTIGNLDDGKLARF